MVLFFENELILIGTEEFNTKLLKHLEKYIFNEDVSVNNSEIFDTYAIVAEENYSGDSILNEPGFYSLDTKTKLLTIDNDFIHNSKVYLFNSEIFNSGYFNIFKKYDGMLYDSFRVGNFLPESGKEITEKVTPLECIPGKFVSFSKGCYIGQEIIVRLDVQNKLPKILKRFSFTSDSEIGEIIFSFIKNSETECGYITTKVFQNGIYQCLGFIRSRYLSEDSEFFVKANNQNIFINLY